MIHWSTFSRILESQKHWYTEDNEDIQFVATLMKLSEVLPVLTCLSIALQAKTADFTLVASQLT